MSYIINEKDIYYNKDKFDSGEINLVFITGLSGSGKSTMAKDMHDKDNIIENIRMDDLACIKENFTLNELKKYGDLIYSFFNGIGKKYYVDYDYLDKNNIETKDYEDKLYPDFIHYCMQYAKMHKNKKYVIEGIWILEKSFNGHPYFKPEEFKDYAFYIKGTSLMISKHREALRDSRYADNKKEVVKSYINFTRSNLKWYFFLEKQLKIFRKYFSDLMKEK